MDRDLRVGSKGVGWWQSSPSQLAFSSLSLSGNPVLPKTIGKAVDILRWGAILGKL